MHTRCSSEEDWYLLQPNTVLSEYVVTIKKAEDCEYPVNEVKVFSPQWIQVIVILDDCSIKLRKEYPATAMIDIPDFYILEEKKPCYEGELENIVFLIMTLM